MESSLSVELLEFYLDGQEYSNILIPEKRGEMLQFISLNFLFFIFYFLFFIFYFLFFIFYFLFFIFHFLFFIFYFLFFILTTATNQN